MHHGQCGLCRVGTESRASGRNLRRTAAGSGCHDRQQGLWLRTQSSRTRGASDPDRKQFHRRRRRHGIDDQCALSSAASAQGISSGQRADRRFHGERRPVGHLQQLPHGRHRRERGGEIRHHARGAGRVRAQLSPQGAGCDQGMPVQVTDCSGGAGPEEKGRRLR